MINAVLVVIHRVIDRVMNPWLYSNAELLEEVRIAKRDANAAKVAVTRLRTELRGEVFAPEVPDGTVRVAEGPTPVPIRRTADSNGLAGIRPGTSMTKYMESRR